MVIMHSIVLLWIRNEIRTVSHQSCDHESWMNVHSALSLPPYIMKNTIHPWFQFNSFDIVLDIIPIFCFQLIVSLLLVLAVSMCLAGGTTHRHVLIHVPVRIKHHHHTHTIYKHIKHHEHHEPEYKVLGYELGGHGHGWGGGSGGIGGGYGGYDSSIGGHGIDLSGGYSSWGAPELGSYESNHYGGDGWEDDK